MRGSRRGGGQLAVAANASLFSMLKPESFSNWKPGYDLSVHFTGLWLLKDVFTPRAGGGGGGATEPQGSTAHPRAASQNQIQAPE